MSVGLLALAGMPSRNARCAAVEAVRGEDIRPGYAQELHGEAGLEAIEIGAVDHQSRLLVDRDDDVVAVEDLEHGGCDSTRPGSGGAGRSRRSGTRLGGSAVESASRHARWRTHSREGRQ